MKEGTRVASNERRLKTNKSFSLLFHFSSRTRIKVQQPVLYLVFSIILLTDDNTVVGERR